MPYNSNDPVFELLKQHTTLDSVSDFLRKKNLVHTAQSWEKMVNTRLIPSLEEKTISLDELNLLVSDSEEHGKQHIFLYELSSTTALELLSKLRVDAIVQDLKLTGLPKVILTPSKSEIVDVRLIEGESLTIKSLDKRESKYVLSDEISGNRQTICWEIRAERAVNVARLLSSGTLEVRLQSIAGASRHYVNELKEFWALLDPFIPFPKVSKTSIQTAKAYLWEKRADLAKRVRYTDSTLRNDNGFRVTATGDNQADINSDEGTSSCLDQFYSMKGYCDTANVWFIREDENDSKPIHIILSGDVNEFHLPQKCSRSDYEYCLKTLREFNKKVPTGEKHHNSPE